MPVPARRGTALAVVVGAAIAAVRVHRQRRLAAGAHDVGRDRPDARRRRAHRRRDRAAAPGRHARAAARHLGAARLRAARRVHDRVAQLVADAGRLVAGGEPDARVPGDVRGRLRARAARAAALERAARRRPARLDGGRRLGAADQGPAGRARARRAVRAAAPAVRLLEQRRARGRADVVPLLWLAVRRSGHAAVNALAWPALGLAVVCMLLSYSRGALLASLLGVALWLAIVPLRLASVVVLGSVLAVTVPLVAWAFAQDGLTLDSPPLSLRVDAGLELGALLLLLICTLLVAGLAAGFLAAHYPPGERIQARASRVLVGALVVVPAIAILALANSPGGLNGQVSKAWKQATDPAAHTPGNTPSRLTATSSVRSRYWREALDVHAASPWLGGGAGSYATLRLRYRTDRPGRPARPRLRRADAGRPRLGGPGGLAARDVRVAVGRGAHDRPAAARPRPALGRRADRHGGGDRRRGRVRRALGDRLDLVRARQRRARAAVRGLGGRRAGRCASGCRPPRRPGRSASGSPARWRPPGSCACSAWSPPGRRCSRCAPRTPRTPRTRGSTRARSRRRSRSRGSPTSATRSRSTRCSTSRRSSSSRQQRGAGSALEQAVEPRARQPGAVAPAGRVPAQRHARRQGRAAGLPGRLLPRSAVAAEHLRRARRVARGQRLALATSRLGRARLMRTLAKPACSSAAASERRVKKRTCWPSGSKCCSKRVSAIAAACRRPW